MPSQGSLYKGRTRENIVKKIQLLALKMEGGHGEGRNARQHPEAEKYKEMDSPRSRHTTLPTPC